MRKTILVGAAALALAAFAEEDSSGRVGDVRLKGYLGERLDRMIERHVIGTDADYITAPFLEKTETKGWWQTEFWGKLGDIVMVKFDMPVVAHRLESNVAFTRGPVLLARDSRFNDGDMMKPFRAGIKDGQRMTGFAPVRTPSDAVWMTFAATLDVGSHHENPEGAYPASVFFCDYASAGNTWDRDNYYRTWFPVELDPTDR